MKALDDMVVNDTIFTIMNEVVVIPTNTRVEVSAAMGRPGEAEVPGGPVDPVSAIDEIGGREQFPAHRPARFRLATADLNASPEKKALRALAAMLHVRRVTRLRQGP